MKDENDHMMFVGTTTIHINLTLNVETDSALIKQVGSKEGQSKTELAKDGIERI